MAKSDEMKHKWHVAIVALLVLILLVQVRIYRSQQHLKTMVSEGILQLKEAR